MATIGDSAARPAGVPLDTGWLRDYGYTVERELGRGAMGAVFLARHVSGQIRAVKVPLNLTVADARRFRREADALRRIEHENVVSLLDVSREDAAYPFIACEFCVWGTLAERRPRLLCRQAAELASSVARGVGAIHRAGVVHRDLKPANILFDGHGTPKVADFGLVTAGEAGGTLVTLDGRLVGTPAYMAPEQARGDAVTPAADVWAVGVLLYELLCGTLPFRGDTPAAMVAAVCTEHPVPPRERDRAIPPGLEALCLRCLAKEPAERFADGDALFTALTGWLGSDEARSLPPVPAAVTVPGVEAPVVPSSVPPTRAAVEPRPPRWRDAAMGAGLLAALVACLGGPLALSTQADREAEVAAWRDKAAVAADRANQLEADADSRRQVIADWAEKHRAADAAARASADRALFLEGELIGMRSGLSEVPEQRERAARLGAMLRLEQARQAWAHGTGPDPANVLGRVEPAFRDRWEVRLTERHVSGGSLIWRGGGPTASAVAWHPSGAALAVGPLDGDVRLLDAVSGTPVLTMKRNLSGVRALAWSPDGLRLAVGRVGFDSAEVHFWDIHALNESKPVRTVLLPTTPPNLLSALAWSPDGTRLLASANPLVLIDARSAAATPIDSGEVSAAGWSPCGRYWVSSGAEVRLWDAANRVVVHTYSKRDELAKALAWRPDGLAFAAGFADGTVRLARAPNEPDWFREHRDHTGDIYTIAWTRDGRHLLSGGWDNRVYAWQPNANTSRRLVGHTNTVNALAPSPDGTRVASASADGSVRVWDLRTGPFAFDPDALDRWDEPADTDLGFLRRWHLDRAYEAKSLARWEVALFHLAVVLDSVPGDAEALELRRMVLRPQRPGENSFYWARFELCDRLAAGDPEAARSLVESAASVPNDGNLPEARLAALILAVMDPARPLAEHARKLLIDADTPDDRVLLAALQPEGNPDIGGKLRKAVEDRGNRSPEAEYFLARDAARAGDTVAARKWLKLGDAVAFDFARRARLSAALAGHLGPLILPEEAFPWRLPTVDWRREALLRHLRASVIQR